MITKIFAKALLVCFAMFMTASVAFAGVSIDSAKADGLVGERPDGLLGAVTSPSADVQSLVSTTNAQRMDKYNAIAAKNGTPVGQVQALAGQTLIAKTPSGQYIMTASGSWQQK